jgi:hypothetical protein
MKNFFERNDPQKGDWIETGAMGFIDSSAI